MSTYYLFDMHVGSIEDARIVDVITTTESGGEFRVDGLTPVRVPDGVHVENPQNLLDLLQQKYAGLLAQYPGFSHIIYDDLLDADDIVSYSRLTKLGARGSIAGGFRSTDLDVSGLVVAVTQFVLVYEHFTWRCVIPREGHVERHYVEEPEAAHRAIVSVNGGSTFVPAQSGALVVLEPSDQGASVRVGIIASDGEVFDVATQRRVVSSGSWALIF